MTRMQCAVDGIALATFFSQISTRREYHTREVSTDQHLFLSEWSVLTIYDLWLSTNLVTTLTPLLIVSFV